MDTAMTIWGAATQTVKVGEYHGHYEEKGKSVQKEDKGVVVYVIFDKRKVKIIECLR